MVMRSADLGMKNDCAGEDEQQFTLDRGQSVGSRQ
jgi:hypothetical protein